MASIFLYGPYAAFTWFGLPPGAEESWSFGPWSWYADAVVITAHPLGETGLDRTMEVVKITSQAAPDGSRFINCTVRNTGVDSANYAIWIGGVQP